MRILFLILTVIAVTTGCSGRLNDLGQEPAFTPIGHNQEYLTGVDRRHTGVLGNAPRPTQANYSEGSLWNSGPSSLFGDRRAQSLLGNSANSKQTFTGRR